MIKSSWIKSGFKIIVIMTLVFLLNISEDYSIFNKVHNYEINESFGMIAMVEKEKEEKPIVVKVESKEETTVQKKVKKVENKEYKKNEVKSSISRTGVLTGYAANCKSCGGTLACKSSYKVKNNGVVTYPDSQFGSVRIVASSKNLACGSIVRFSLWGTTITAIVLDRGVLGNNLDLLMTTEKEASNKVGRRNITYQILRNGW